MVREVGSLGGAGRAGSSSRCGVGECRPFLDWGDFGGFEQCDEVRLLGGREEEEASNRAHLFPCLSVRGGVGTFGPGLASTSPSLKMSFLTGGRELVVDMEVEPEE